MNPYLFIVGCPRSGTTLLSRMMDAHPLISMLKLEQHWIIRYFKKRKGITADGFITAHLLDCLLANKKFGKLNLQSEILEFYKSDSLPYSTFISAIFDAYGSHTNRKLVGVKNPGCALELQVVHTLWPWAKIIHLIRDGRDVCLSANSWEKLHKLRNRFSSWTEHPVTTAALWWQWHVQSAREAARLLRPQLYHEVRYEDLVKEPASECAKICEFLDIPYSNDPLKFYLGKTRDGKDAKHSWLPITAGLRDWKTQMASEGVVRFEAVAGNTLARCGYELSGFSIPQQELESAVRLTEQFSREANFQASTL